MSPTPAATTATPPESGAASRERWTIALLALVTLFLFADQNLMAPNLTQIANDFGFDALERDTKLGGEISLAFWMLGGIVALAIGYLADRVHRKRLFVAVVLIGEIPCLLTGFARSYEELFWLRAATGIGIGGALPLVYSLLGDLFGPRLRAAASAGIGFAMGLGVALGQLLAGTVGAAHGWRLPFLIVAAPNFVLGVLFWLTTREPRRGAREDIPELAATPYAARLDWAAYKRIFRIRTNLLALLQGIPGTVPWGVFFIFLNDYYAQDKGYSVATATLIVMTVGGAAILGGLAGGLLGNRVYNRNPRHLPILCGVSTLIGIVPTLLLLEWPSQIGVPDPSPAGPLALGFVTGFLVTITGPNVRAMLLNVNAPETRGSVLALFNLADDLGKGFGPAVISLLIAQLGRALAFDIATLFWVLCALALFGMARTFPRDEATLRARLRQVAGSRAVDDLGRP